MDKFKEVAKKLGHDVSRLEKGDVLQTVVEVQSIEEFRDLFGERVSARARSLYSERLKAALPPNALTENTPEHFYVRLGMYVYGDAPLSEKDREAVKKLFPVKVNTVSGENHNVTTDETYGPSAAPTVLNYGTLNFNGGSISALNTVVSIYADNVVVNNTGGKKQYHLGSLGVQGKKPDKAANGISYTNPAAHGKDVSAWSSGICTGCGDGGNGTAGADGGNGHPGTAGHNGEPNLQMNITFKDLNCPTGQKLVVFSQSGPGGDGGDAGDGGKGQDGGRGGNGCDSGCEGTDGGNGNNGGRGGDGGKGGAGGNGVDGNEVFIKVPPIKTDLVNTFSNIVPPGKGGGGGAAGAGGAGGAAGSGGKHSQDGSAGGHGNPGTVGENGEDGKRSGNPGDIHIN